MSLKEFFLRNILLALAASAIFFASSGVASAADSKTALFLSELIRVNTSNPPGNEKALDELLASKFKPLGFEVEIIPTPDAVKAHFIARLKGDGSAKPILLAAHADVVGVERDKWTLNPFAGIIKDGFVYGRGALDFKGGMAVFAEAVIRLAEKKIPLKRDIIFLSEADEESGKYNTVWLSQSHWDKIDCEFALNEGGWIMKKPDGSVRYVSISTADKSAITLLVTAHGTSTHSSLPRPDNAIFRLARAMAKLSEYDTKPRLIPSTREFFMTLAKTSQPPASTYFENLVNSADPAVVEQAAKMISENPLLHAIMRNTIAPVFLQAGFRGNVIPGSATATINFRAVPGTTSDELIAEMKKVFNDPDIDVILPPANSEAGATNARYAGLAAKSKASPTDTDLYKALTGGAHKVWPDVPVTPYLFQAGTDALAWRSRGVPVYGIYPYPISDEDLSRMHGNDERMSIQSLDQGTEMIYETLLEVAAK
jgi:acetylornithine deacetylase/succinyl-diaminopimelate desuccinylase-like protein